jgi:hypothetical protein
MAKRKKRARAQPKKQAKLRKKTLAARIRARKASKSARRGGTKRSVGRAKPKRAMKGAPRKKQQRMRSLGREVETVVVDVIEEPAPGVITVTEFEEMQVPRRGWVETEGNREP